jgi:hypothetical protein
MHGVSQGLVGLGTVTVLTGGIGYVHALLAEERATAVAVRVLWAQNLAAVKKLEQRMGGGGGKGGAR